MNGFNPRPFRLSDLDHYRERAVEIWARDWFDGDLTMLEADPYAQTVEIDGAPACSGGLADQGGGRAIAWAVLTEILPGHVMAVHKTYRRALLASRFRHIETYVEASFHVSLRWCRLLGFETDAMQPTVMVNRMLFIRMIFEGDRR